MPQKTAHVVQFSGPIVDLLLLEIVPVEWTYTRLAETMYLFRDKPARPRSVSRLPFLDTCRSRLTKLPINSAVVYVRFSTTSPMHYELFRCVFVNDTTIWQKMQPASRILISAAEAPTQCRLRRLSRFFGRRWRLADENSAAAATPAA